MIELASIFQRCDPNPELPAGGECWVYDMSALLMGVGLCNNFWPNREVAGRVQIAYIQHLPIDHNHTCDRLQLTFLHIYVPALYSALHRVIIYNLSEPASPIESTSAWTEHEHLNGVSFSPSDQPPCLKYQSPTIRDSHPHQLLRAGHKQHTLLQLHWVLLLSNRQQENLHPSHQPVNHLQCPSAARSMVAQAWLASHRTMLARGVQR